MHRDLCNKDWEFWTGGDWVQSAHTFQGYVCTQNTPPQYPFSFESGQNELPSGQNKTPTGELGRATMCNLGTETIWQMESGLKGTAQTLGLQFCCINLNAYTTPPSLQIAEWYTDMNKELCNSISVSQTFRNNWTDASEVQSKFSTQQNSISKDLYFSQNSKKKNSNRYDYTIEP